MDERTFEGGTVARSINASCISLLLLAGCDLTVPWSESPAAAGGLAPGPAELTYVPESLEFAAVLGDPAPPPQKIYVTSDRPIAAQISWGKPPIASVTPAPGGFVVRVIAPELTGTGDFSGGIILIPCEAHEPCLAVNAQATIGVHYTVGPRPP